jgi:TolB-like protein
MSESQYRFAEFQLDCASFELRRQGRAQKSERVSLERIPMELLILLLERQGSVVTRQEIVDRLWGKDVFVDTEHGINTAIRKIRTALREDVERPRFIQTVSRKGYRFVPDAVSTEGNGMAASAEILIAARPVPANEVSTRGYGLVAEVETLPQRHEVKESLAVLPLENLSRDPEQEYLANGLTDALTTTLAKISGLSVTSRTTAMQYKGIRKPLPEIARELGVRKVIEGTIQRFGDRVRISVKLIDAEMDIHLWAESYERGLRDLLVLESEIARAVANEIRLKLTPEELNQLTSVAEVDPAAYDAYLKGSYYWSLRTLGGYEKGAEYFRQAIEKDSSFAAPEAGIAELVWRCSDGLDWLRNEPRFVNLLRALQFAT